eukprot:TRINITY_DN957_c0_g2_i1.p1 TRINITY_DN957_c0_g2~~TRINITY_DN957_c0_g2_i1.p1  ORF type:complete len:468 (-),score=51.84 TRINITY_DN957_c0_g2_i1:1369-2772(-)
MARLDAERPAELPPISISLPYGETHARGVSSVSSASNCSSVQPSPLSSQPPLSPGSLGWSPSRAATIAPLAAGGSSLADGTPPRFAVHASQASLSRRTSSVDKHCAGKEEKMDADVDLLWHQVEEDEEREASSLAPRSNSSPNSIGQKGELGREGRKSGLSIFPAAMTYVQGAFSGPMMPTSSSRSSDDFSFSTSNSPLRRVASPRGSKSPLMDALRRTPSTSSDTLSTVSRPRRDFSLPFTSRQRLHSEARFSLPSSTSSTKDDPLKSSGESVSLQHRGRGGTFPGVAPESMCSFSSPTLFDGSTVGFDLGEGSGTSLRASILSGFNMVPRISEERASREEERDTKEGGVESIVERENKLTEAQMKRRAAGLGRTLSCDDVGRADMRKTRDALAREQLSATAAATRAGKARAGATASTAARAAGPGEAPSGTQSKKAAVVAAGKAKAFLVSTARIIQRKASMKIKL